MKYSYMILNCVKKRGKKISRVKLTEVRVTVISELSSSVEVPTKTTIQFKGSILMTVTWTFTKLSQPAGRNIKSSVTVF